MSGFRVYMRRGGWQVTDGEVEHGPFPTYQQALLTADNLNLHRRAQEERSFAPAATRANVQGGVPLPPDQHRLATEVTFGDRREARIAPNDDGKEKVIHGEKPDHPLPPNMVAQTNGAEPDMPIGDVMEYPGGPPVWEAREEPAPAEPPSEADAAAAAVERARVKGTDSPAAGQQSFGGGLV